MNLKSWIALLLTGAGLLFASLTLGAFAQLNPDIPSTPDIRPLTIFKALDGVLAATLNFFAQPDLQKFAFSRGFTYMGLAIVFSAIAASLVSTTRAQSIARPGRRA